MLHPTQPLAQQINKLADRCVQCGLCAQHCPTYILTNNEAESPRGRISIMRALATQQLTPSAKMHEHLDHCLTCRACENVCPSEVEYGKLIDSTRAFVAENFPRKKPWWQRLIFIIFTQHFTLRLFKFLLRFYQKIQYEYKAIGKEHGVVGLHTGCVQSIVDQKTLKAAIKLLTHHGYRVIIPREQGCCGALHLHSGEHKKAEQLLQHNLHAFAKANVENVISVATGCGSFLHEADETFSESNFNNLHFFDIHQFLLEKTSIAQTKFSPLAQEVYLHTPCSLKNVLKQENFPHQLLKLIPQLKINKIADQYCCGAAGINYLAFPHTAKQLAAKIIDHIPSGTLLTTNIGCQLHLRRQASALTVLHPIVLLAQQLPIQS